MIFRKKNKNLKNENKDSLKKSKFSNIIYNTEDKICENSNILNDEISKKEHVNFEEKVDLAFEYLKKDLNLNQKINFIENNKNNKLIKHSNANISIEYFK